ncbi:MAG: hypothetical protein U0326_32045 [Polyangiales bacterium]
MRSRWIAALHPRSRVLPAAWLQYTLLTGPDLAFVAVPLPPPPRHTVVAAVTRPAKPVVTKPVPPIVPRVTLPRRGFVGVAESRDGRVAAVWTRSRLYVTRDGGRSFTRALDHRGAIATALVDERGTVFVLRPPRALGVQRADGAEVWRSMPFVVRAETEEEPNVAAASNGTRAAWIVVNVSSGNGEPDSRMALTDDEGETWRVIRMPVTTDRGIVDVNADGALRVLLWESDCSYDSVTLFRLAADATRFPSRGRYIRSEPREARFDREGWLHGTIYRWCPELEAECPPAFEARDETGRLQHLSAREIRDRAPWFSVIDGRLRVRVRP